MDSNSILTAISNLERYVLARLDALDAKFLRLEIISARLDALEGNVHNLHSKFDEKFQQVNTKFDEKFQQVNTKLDSFSDKIQVLDEKIDSVQSFTNDLQNNSSTGKRVTFESMLQAWQTYTTEHNTTQIPKSEGKLNTWARDMRKAYKNFKNNKKSTMTKQREEQLIAANFPFLPPTPTMLSPIKNNEGAGNVSTVTTKVGKNPSTSNVAISAAPIKAKVTTATTKVDKDPSTSNVAISTGSIKPKRATFKSMLDEWLTYSKEHNTMQIPTSEVKLYAWARDTRKAHRAYMNNEPSSMNKQREEQLIAANFPLEVKVTSIQNQISKSPVMNLPSTPSTRSLTKKKDDRN
jgi:Skp family chaperone for outer membrane proteins